MKIIEDVTLSDYRGIDKFSAPCGSINILVGPNNTGKSSILEGVWLGATSPNGYEDRMGGKFRNLLQPNQNSQYMIREGKDDASITLKLSSRLNNETITTDILHQERGFPEDLSDFALNYVKEFKTQLTEQPPKFPYRKDSSLTWEGLNELLRKRRELARQRTERSKRLNAHPDTEGSKKGQLTQELEELEDRINRIENEVGEEIEERIVDTSKIIIKSQAQDEIFNIQVLTTGGKEKMNQFPLLENQLKKLQVSVLSSEQNLTGEVGALYEALVDSKKLWDALEFLEEKIQYFEDIREIRDQLHILLGDIDEPLPLETMGDGFKAILKLTFMTTLTEKGIVILEEPENSMHPGYLDIFGQKVVDNSDLSQIFITTHSHELLDHILKHAKEAEKLDNVGIWRLNRTPKGRIEREVMDGAEGLSESTEIETDLRGY